MSEEQRQDGGTVIEKKMEVKTTSHGSAGMVCAPQDHSHWQQFIITLILSAMVFYALHGIFTVAIPEGNQRIADVFLGYLMGGFSVGLAFWYSTNAQSARKDEVIANSTPGNPGV